ncbi:hypothetical protein [Erythrobacter donghaensis]|jgi:hypothetical protein|uniref:hypothetical protein n=1 Tax=Erythrobacter donghaensis TaxID=267135 RepID=UPI0012D85AD7|nr:hypothetical protein [Erythrobacter donghaensis]
MPERQLPNAVYEAIVQVRKMRMRLQNTQLERVLVQICAQTCKFLPKMAATAQNLSRKPLRDRFATQHESRFDFDSRKA